MCALSPKRGNDGDFRLGAATTTSVIGLDQIENELRLVQARFILAESGVETFALSPSEVNFFFSFLIKPKDCFQPSGKN